MGDIVVMCGNGSLAEVVKVDTKSSKANVHLKGVKIKGTHITGGADES